MPSVIPFTFEQLAVLLQTTLRNAIVLNYCPDTNIIICNPNDKDVLPTFDSYSIRIFPADSGFITKRPRIGNYYRNIYAVGIELLVKSFSSTANRLLSGNIRKNKGIWEFFQDVSNTLEHNTLSNNMDPFPGSNIQSPVTLQLDERQIDGVGFIWMGNQDNTK